MRRSLLLIISLCCIALIPIHALAADTLKVGTKRFTESYVLGEILTQTAAPFAEVEQKAGLGNTAIVFEALKSGSIDVYPEYLGTIDLELLHHQGSSSLEQINRELAPLGLGAGVALGFNNSYALAVRAGDQKSLGIYTLSDLARQPALRYGLSHEFLGRADGWPGLARQYSLHVQPMGLDHGIAYTALAQNQVDVIDIYSTDAQIRQYGLAVLKDDAGYFPRYDAVLLYRLDLPQRFPRAWQAMQQLRGRIGESDMIGMNAAAELDGKAFRDIARQFLRPESGIAQSSGLWGKLFDASLWRLTRQHVLLVLLSVGAAALCGIPLGMLAALRPAWNQPIMALVGVLQTIPSLALLAMLIPLLGSIGTAPALIALFLYALLPVVRSTCIGIEQVPPEMRLAALALGLRAPDCIRFVVLPLASPVILSGIKTAAVMSVGTATIAAFIGAGGYGERIATGLALNDNDMLLAGAIPAAALALITQFLFEMAERRLGKR
ncbi:MAG TPA: glycine betaine ABC transporter substrate-binding protein [Burkholderiaceae bacterium]|jgi:osmoprotectant transport system permease protein